MLGYFRRGWGGFGCRALVYDRKLHRECMGPCAGFTFGLLFKASLGGRVLVNFLGTLFSNGRIVRSIACLGARRLNDGRVSHQTIFSICYRGRGKRGVLVRVREKRRRFFGSQDVCCTACPVERRTVGKRV